MIYYGGNDYRDYLAHHGVLGMKWGIRRYQPYSIGYQREGGEGGKEIGEARSYGGSSIARDKKKQIRALNRNLSKLEKTRDVSKIKLWDANRKAKLASAKGKKNAEKLNAKVEKYKKRLDDAEKSINSILDEAKKNGMGVKESIKTRDIAAGRKAVATAVGALTGAYVGGTIGRMHTSSVVLNPVTSKLFDLSAKGGAALRGNMAARAIESSIKNPITGAITGGLTGAALGRAGYSAAYRAIHKRGSTIKGAHYQITDKSGYRLANSPRQRFLREQRDIERLRRQRERAAEQRKAQQKEQREKSRKQRKDIKRSRPEDVYELLEEEKRKN